MRNIAAYRCVLQRQRRAVPHDVVVVRIRADSGDVAAAVVDSIRRGARRAVQPHAADVDVEPIAVEIFGVFNGVCNICSCRNRCD